MSSSCTHRLDFFDARDLDRLFIINFGLYSSLSRLRLRSLLLGYLRVVLAN